jgi:GNAT superfamily N-acetyltransferase
MSQAAEPTISIVDKAEDFAQAFDCCAATFGTQTEDGIWIAMHPGWKTPEGRSAGIQRMVDRWRATTKDANGDPNTIFLKATIPDAENNANGADRLVGFAIWHQLSAVPGRGDEPPTQERMKANAAAIYPDNEAEQRYIAQLDWSLHRRRIELVHEKAQTASPAVFVLDLCIVHPSFQRRGIARKLVQWGLDEAKRRGDHEAITEASSMGRHVYLNMGFQREGSEIQYDVDPEFASRKLPSNIFLRTRPAL